jgi:hypothetical protein
MGRFETIFDPKKASLGPEHASLFYCARVNRHVTQSSHSFDLVLAVLIGTPGCATLRDRKQCQQAMKLRRGGSLLQVTFRLTRGRLLPILISLSISNQHILLVVESSLVLASTVELVFVLSNSGGSFYYSSKKKLSLSR